MDANTEYLFKDTLSLSMYAPDKPKVRSQGKAASWMRL